MTSRDGSTSINMDRSPKPPATPGRAPKQPAEGTQEHPLDTTIDSLITAIVETIKGTEWPEDSKEAAEGLMGTLEQSPGIPNTTDKIPQNMRDLIEQYAQVLEDVQARLKDASSKTGIKNWKVYQNLRSIASKRPRKCKLLFQTCQDDVVKAVNSLREHMDSDRSKVPKEQVPPRGSSAQELSVPLTDARSNPTEQVIVSPSSTATPNPVLPGVEDEESRGPIQVETLNIARMTFKAVEIASGSIPVVGTFVGAAAKVGLAFIETVQTMDKNDDLAKDLGAQTAKLCKLLTSVADQPKGDHGELIAGHITDLHRELGDTLDKVTRWKSLGLFNKALHSRDHSETLESYQGTIQNALEELQLLVSLDSRNMTHDLRDVQAQEQKRRLLDRLGDGKYGAQGNAIQDVICFPGTRVEILKRINSWIRDASAPERVLWIRGMAGRGKSTIASTVAHDWRCRASCAIFHFRRGQSTVNARFVCTLARQLGSSLVPEVKNAILDTVRENQDIANQRLEEQFETLLVAPLSKLDSQSHPTIIIVDALDECDNPKDAVDFLRLIDRHSPSLPANVKFLLTCRPEAPLIRALEPKKWHIEDLDKVVDVSEDLERFIEQAFKQIRDSDLRLPTDWPSSEDVRRLVEMSQGLFQWARTAITYVGDGSPVNRLRALLKRPSMWGQLDGLYYQILSKAFDSVRLDPARRDLLSRVLGTLIVAPYPVSLEIIGSLYSKHEVLEETSDEGIIQFLREDILADLNSLLFIPTSPAKPMYLMHTSIRDLLVSKERCGHLPYYIEPICYHRQLANLCLEMVLRDLKENVRDQLDVSKPSPETQDNTEEEIPRGLRYCCQSWSIHLSEAIGVAELGTDTAATELLANFELFSREKVMSWLEVISIIGATTEAIGMAKRTHGWLSQLDIKSRFDPLVVLWNDVQRFITTFKEAISFGPLHIYVSSLPHCPAETEIWKLYGKYAKVRTLRGLQSTSWPANLWARSMGGYVMGVAFAPDGSTVVSASDDGTIQFWDPQTAAAVGEPLTGHAGSVTSICFSRDGRVLASGSDDGSIRLWDPQTGTAVGEPLGTHLGKVYSVCFSPESKILASGSNDGTVRLWDAQARTALGEPLKGHDDWVSSVCFSPDGKTLASGSEDSTIRLWDPHTGVAVGGPLTGHTDRVRSVCFSPDGKVLASGSADMTIRLWDPQTRTAVGGPLEAHSSCVSSICFSPDGKVLASASYDKTIRLWDPHAQTSVGESHPGHGDFVYSVCFSPDGKILASGSHDCTIRLWNPHSGAAVGELSTSYKDGITAICLSPTGKVLASGSNDGSIRLWDAQTGATIGEPLTGHSHSVSSICFSNDGTILASGSVDKTIRLWDSQVRVPVGEPLTGHSDPIASVCFSPDGKVLASGSYDRTIRLWDLQTRTAMGEPLAGHSFFANSVCFSPDGTVFAFASEDKTIRLRDPHTGSAVGEPLRGHSDWISSICFSPDGKVLASGSYDKTIRLWDLQTGATVGELPTDHSQLNSLISIGFSSDRILMARYWDGSSTTWDTATSQRCDDSLSVLSYANPWFRDHWITLFSSPLFWLPPQYWGDVRRVIILSGRTLVVLNDGTLSFFDLSQVLRLPRS